MNDLTGSFCKAKTRKQVEASTWGESHLGCGNKASVVVNDNGEAERTGTPVCKTHQTMWARGYNYGVNN